MGFAGGNRLTTAEERREADLTPFQEVGQILASARIKKNLTIQEVADEIYVRQQYLIALEEGQLVDLPGRVYIIGFIRNYARLLSLDGEDLIRRINALPNLPDYERRNVSIAPPSVEEGPNGYIVAISLILVIITAVCAYVFLKPQTKISRGLSEGVAQRSATLSSEKQSDQESEPGNEIHETPLELFKAPEINQPFQPGMTTREGLFSSKTQDLTVGSTSQKTILRAKEPTWIEIRDETGRVLFMKVLQPGQEYTLPERSGLTLNTGNAGGIDIFLGEKKLLPLGEHGQVRRDVPFESLR